MTAAPPAAPPSVTPAAAPAAAPASPADRALADAAWRAHLEQLGLLELVEAWQPGTQLRLTIGNIKGGTAKSTTAVYIALLIWMITGERVLLVDADRISQTTNDWAQMAGAAWPDAITVIPWAVDDLAKRVRAVAGDYRHVIIDTGGDDEERLAQALLVTDHLIVPLAPSVADFRRLPATMNIAAKADALSPVSVVVLLVKVAQNRDADGRWLDVDAKRIKGMATDAGMVCLDAAIPAAKPYMRVMGTIPEDFEHYAAVVAELLS